jgi:periplasmic divalent cation tolerance protein
MSQYGVVLVTTVTQAEGLAIAQVLVQQKLAACVNLFPVQSIYIWQGDLCEDQEWQLVIKTQLDHFSELETAIRAHHSYEVPEIIALPLAAGAEPYLAWIKAQTSTPEPQSPDSGFP